MIPCGSPDSALNPAYNPATHARCPGSRLSEPALCSGSPGLSPISLIPNGQSEPPRWFRIPHCIPLGTSTLVRDPRLARHVTSRGEARLQQPGPTGTHAWRFRCTVIDRASGYNPACKYRAHIASPMGLRTTPARLDQHESISGSASRIQDRNPDEGLEPGRHLPTG